MAGACPPLPPVIGHRGAAAHAPENTLAGFRRAAALGCGWIEFDVRLTGDGMLVLSHDDAVKRTTGAAGRVSAMTLAELRRLDAGGWFAPEFAGETIPTLDEALALAGELGLGANIEIKAERGRAEPTAKAVVTYLAAHRTAVPILVSSFLDRALAVCRGLLPQTPLGLLVGLARREWRQTAARLDCATVNLAERRLTPRLVGDIRAAGYRVLAYTVNDPARAAALFEWGVTSVFSDAPDIILCTTAPSRQGALG